MAALFRAESNANSIYGRALAVFEERERGFINKEKGCWDADDRVVAWFMLIDHLHRYNDPLAANYYKKSLKNNVWTGKFVLNGEKALIWKERFDKIFHDALALEAVEQKVVAVADVAEKKEGKEAKEEKKS